MSYQDEIDAITARRDAMLFAAQKFEDGAITFLDGKYTLGFRGGRI